jgi:tripartite-type tricarboxylate transporter receptor subunit TctC
VATTPEVPTERVAALRQAFQAMLKDEQFKADAERSRMDIGDMDGEQVEKLVKAMELPKDAVALQSDSKKSSP